MSKYIQKKYKSTTYQFCVLLVVMLMSFFCNPIEAAVSSSTNTISDSDWPTAKEQKILDEYTQHSKLISPHDEQKRFFRIQSNPLNYDNEIFFNKLELEQTTYLEPIKFILVKFNKPVVFTLSIFKKSVMFSNIKANEFMNFEWAIFEDSANFSYGKFKKVMNFYQTVFKKNVSFYSSTFNVVNFTDANFDGEAVFTKTAYDGKAVFSFSIFKNTALFDKTIFNNIADFSQTTFEGPLVFNNASFKQILNLSGSQFNSSVSFQNVELPKFLDLSYVTQIKESISFSNVNLKYNKNTKINLIGTRVDKLILDYAFFNLYFPKNTDENDIKNVYEKLLKVQTKNGFLDGYKKLKIEYATYSYKMEKQYITYFFDKYLWNFGFDKSHLILVVIYIIVFFSLINASMFVTLEEKVCTINFLNIRSGSDFIENNFILRYLFYLPLSFIYTTILLFGGFIGFRISLYDIKETYLPLAIYLVLMLISGFISTFFLLQTVFML